MIKGARRVKDLIRNKADGDSSNSHEVVARVPRDPRAYRLRGDEDAVVLVEQSPIALTVESGYHSASLKNQGVRIFYVKPEWYGLGISEAESPGGHAVRAYDRERTVCDVVRRVELVGEHVGVHEDAGGRLLQPA